MPPIGKSNLYIESGYCIMSFIHLWPILPLLYSRLGKLRKYFLVVATVSLGVSQNLIQFHGCSPWSKLTSLYVTIIFFSDIFLIILQLLLYSVKSYFILWNTSVIRVTSRGRERLVIIMATLTLLTRLVTFRSAHAKLLELPWSTCNTFPYGRTAMACMCCEFQDSVICRWKHGLILLTLCKIYLFVYWQPVIILG